MKQFELFTFLLCHLSYSKKQNIYFYVVEFGALITIIDTYFRLCISLITSMNKSGLFLSYFRSLIEHECTVDVELRNDIILSGKLDFIDNNMCMWLTIQPQQISKLAPQFAGLKNGFYIRGSAIRSIAMPTIESDIETLSQMCKNK